MKRDDKTYNYQRAEIALLQEIGEVATLGDDYYFISKRFPSYMGGNGVIINSNKFSSLESIIVHFTTLYPGISSYTVYYFDEENREAIAQDALLAEHDIERIKIMFVPAHQFQPATSPTKPGMPIRVLKDEIDWELYRSYQSNCHTDRWFAEEGYEKTRFIANHLDMQWHALFDKRNSQILSIAGLLKVNNIARIEDVQTLPQAQRKGYATEVLETISKLLIEEKTIEEVYLGVAASNYKAISLYAKMGFEALPCELMEITITPQENI